MPISKSTTPRQPPLYFIWANLKRRCYNKATREYEQYGGRGIDVCIAIRESLDYFAHVIGKRPKGHSVDRRDNNGGYWCGRCEECVRLGRPLNIRWATPKQQANNTRKNVWLTKDGETQTIAQWSESLGVPSSTLHVRKMRGVEILAPVKPRRKSIFTKNPPRPKYTRAR